jgi:site-specific recombinase XerD
VNWIDAIAAHRAWLLAGGASTGTAKVFACKLRGLAKVAASPFGATSDELIAFLGNPDWKPNTRKSGHTAVKSFYRWATMMGHVTIDPTFALTSVKVPLGVPRPTPEAVVTAALQQADARKRRMVMLAAYQGLRRAEIACVHSRDIVEDTLRVHGKGGKIRVVPLHPAVAQAGAGITGYWFPGKIDGHLSPWWVGTILSDLLGPDWTGHTLRHRFATKAYETDRDLFAVQQLLGHARPESTAIYTRVPINAMSRAVMGAGPAAA